LGKHNNKFQIDTSYYNAVGIRNLLVQQVLNCVSSNFK
jgi:hypothetical protein